jgi:hypothetical protein
MARGHVQCPALCCGAGLEVDRALDEVVRMTFESALTFDFETSRISHTPALFPDENLLQVL